MSKKLNIICSRIITDSLNRQHDIIPVPQGAFKRFRTLLSLRGRRSGLNSYYRMAQSALTNPKRARRVLQHMLCNYDSLLIQSSIFAHMMVNKFEDPVRVNSDSSTGRALFSYYYKILDQLIPGGTDEGSARRFVGLTTPVKESACQSSEGVAEYFSVAGMLSFLSSSDGYRWFKETFRGISDMGHVAAVAICHLTLTKGNGAQFSYAIDEIIRQRHAMIHDDAIIRPTMHTEWQRMLSQDLRKLYPNEDEETLTALYYIIELAMIPFGIYISDILVNGKNLTRELQGSSAMLRIKALFTGDNRNYGKVNPFDSSDVSHSRSNSRRPSRFIKTLSGIPAMIATCIIIGIPYLGIRGCTSYVRERDISYADNDFIRSYVNHKTLYDNTLLLNERIKVIKEHPEFYDASREQELYLRATGEGWPDKAWYKTFWHIATPPLLHTDMFTPAGKLENEFPNTTRQSNSDQ